MTSTYAFLSGRSDISGQLKHLSIMTKTITASDVDYVRGVCKLKVTSYQLEDFVALCFSSATDCSTNNSNKIQRITVYLYTDYRKQHFDENTIH